MICADAVQRLTMDQTIWQRIPLRLIMAKNVRCNQFRMRIWPCGSTAENI